MTSLATETSRLSRLAQELHGSVILRIAGEVRAMIGQGKEIVNLTVGDFSPREFRVPIEMEDAVVDALRDGETNYPPSAGMDALRVAVQRFYQRYFHRTHAIDEILITAGARPAIYGIFRALVDAGDRVVFGVPGWNNEFYCELTGAEAVPIPCDARTNFMVTADLLRDHLGGARLLSLNSPLNPTGTVFSEAVLADICDLVLEENARRASTGERPLFVMYDQVYWMLTFGEIKHVDPLSLRPELAPYVVYVDATSKAFAATGLRVGWAIGPADVIKPMSDINTHVGAWAPRPEQVASARYLDDAAKVDPFVAHMRKEASARLDAAYAGIQALRAEGLPVDCVRPQGAIYLSARFALHGRRTPDNRVLETDDDVRRYLLASAGVAAIPFGAFGSAEGGGWFRLSIGAVSVAQIKESIGRLQTSVSALGH